MSDKENRVYITSTQEPITNENLDYRAIINNVDFSKECLVSNNILETKLSLLFLAQPKNVILGHILAALSGVLIYALLGESFIAIGAGVALAIFIMIITNTTHPPAGANPIIVILGGKSLSFVFLPVAVGAVTVVLFAIIYSKILGRNYPKSTL